MFFDTNNVFPPHYPTIGGGYTPPSGLGEPITVVSTIVTSAITIFSAIASKNQAIIDGLVTEKMQIKADQEFMRNKVTELRLTRNGLRSELAELLGRRAARNAGLTGMGLFKSRQVKKEQFKLSHNEDVLNDLVSQAENYAIPRKSHRSVGIRNPFKTPLKTHQNEHYTKHPSHLQLL